MDISREQALYIARLARLRLDDDEVENYRTDLSAILGYVEKLNELDVSDVEPTTHAVAMTGALREDAVEQRLGEEEIRANAPAFEAGHFRVPKVVEG